MDYTHWDVELFIKKIEILVVVFLLACLLAGGFILSGIIEAQVILGFSKKDFSILSILLN